MSDCVGGVHRGFDVCVGKINVKSVCICDQDMMDTVLTYSINISMFKKCRKQKQTSFIMKEIR